jgi:hypothetical protein
MADEKLNYLIPYLIEVGGYPDKLLPEGVYRCDKNSLMGRFVYCFPHSKTRDKIATGFFQLKEQCEKIGVELTHWANGSFVTSKVDPGDIDVLHIVDSTDIDSLPPEHQQFVSHVLEGKENTKERFHTDSFLVVKIPKGKPGHEEAEMTIEGWKDFWGHTRPFSPQPGQPPI